MAAYHVNWINGRCHWDEAFEAIEPPLRKEAQQPTIFFIGEHYCTMPRCAGTKEHANKGIYAMKSGFACRTDHMLDLLDLSARGAILGNLSIELHALDKFSHGFSLL